MRPAGGPVAAGANRRLAVGVGGLAVLIAAMDAYVVVTILATVIQDLGTPINHLERGTPIVTGYLLGYVAAMPLLGQLSDRFGRRRVIHGCLAAFGVSSVVTAVAPSIPVLVVGRLLQGAAGGALLPVTFALVGDLWEPRTRPVALGVVGAAQELGSVLGPLYGAGLAALIGWRGLFWVNVPLALIAMVAIQRAVPAGRPSIRAEVPPDVVGGALLAVSLALIIAGLYTTDPQKSALPPWGVPALVVGCLALAGFVVWEARSPSRLLDPAGIRTGPFVSAMVTNFLAGAALMVTLIDIPLLARALLNEGPVGGALLLMWFLIALPVGAVLGGWLSVRVSERATAAFGLALSAFSFWVIAGWPVHFTAAHHHLGPLSVPRVPVDLALAGLGLGLVIAPVTSVTLRASSQDQHGVASAAVVVARMLGMLIGFSGLAAWGVRRFQQLTASLDIPITRHQTVLYNRAVREAVRIEYREIFLITAAFCAAGLAAALALGRSHAAVREPVPEPRSEPAG